MGQNRNRWLVMALLTLAWLAGARASDQDEAVLTVRVSAAEHELAEGYFSLGDTASVMARPGTELYRFLARHRGHAVKITLVEQGARALPRVER